MKNKQRAFSTVPYKPRKNSKKAAINLNQKRKKEEEKKKKEVRKVELIYFCLLKFKGLIRYMHFQGLSHNDIKKISNYIQHTHK